tara:strand:+ start:1734 stop:2621 length:888 start_codon:yes stop_codon:yes gene_type:complete
MSVPTGTIMRSLLFIPGNRLDMLRKGLGFSPDVVIPDLEDSVPNAEKDDAREKVAGIVEEFTKAGFRVIPRINSLNSGYGKQDLQALVGPNIWGINVGKTDRPEDILELDSIITDLESGAQVKNGTIKLIPYIESAMALINAYSIAIASPRVIGLAFGAEDFTKDMGIERTDAGQEIDYPRYVVAVAARAANVMAFDTPNVNFRDEIGLELDIKKAISVGYTGKFAIHPAQIESINRLFVPSEDQVLQAKRIVEAAEKAELEGKGATTLDGKMIDVPIVERAKKLLAKLETHAKD